MERDLRKKFEHERKRQGFKLTKGHEERFLERLEREMPQSRKSNNHIKWLAIAASAILLVTVVGLYQSHEHNEPNSNNAVVNTSQQNTKIVEPALKLGDLSPDLQKIETYYVANINLALSKLKVSDDNEEIVDGYLKQLEELNQEYALLSEELNDIGPNDQTIAAMVRNLQLRAQLLQQLNKKLNQLNTSKNEQTTV